MSGHSHLALVASPPDGSLPFPGSRAPQAERWWGIYATTQQRDVSSTTFVTIRHSLRLADLCPRKATEVPAHTASIARFVHSRSKEFTLCLQSVINQRESLRANRWRLQRKRRNFFWNEETLVPRILEDGTIKVASHSPDFSTENRLIPTVYSFKRPGRALAKRPTLSSNAPRKSIETNTERPNRAGQVKIFHSDSCHSL
jgi:hypothetical protein